MTLPAVPAPKPLERKRQGERNGRERGVKERISSDSGFQATFTF